MSGAFGVIPFLADVSHGARTKKAFFSALHSLETPVDAKTNAGAQGRARFPVKKAGLRFLVDFPAGFL